MIVKIINRWIHRYLFMLHEKTTKDSINAQGIIRETDLKISIILQTKLT